MLQQMHFCCPRCRGPLIGDTETYHCPACQRGYPLVCGIPDFRLSPDPYLSFEDEYKKARVLADKADQVSFESLVRFYWEITPDVPRSAVERYVSYALSGEARGGACLETIDGQVGNPWSGQACLEVGCGTGGFLLAAQSRFRELVGADVALRWLIIAKKRLRSAGERIILVCCSAAHLPFPDETFDGIVGVHVLEHTQDQQRVLAETTRTLKPGSMCFFLTPNRLSLGPEPCVRVWGVGFLPRSLAGRYVQLLKGISYQHIRLLSSLELRRLLSRSGLREWTVSPPRIAECEQQAVSSFTRGLIAVYHVLRRLPVFSFLLQLFGPFLQVIGRK